MKEIFLTIILFYVTTISYGQFSEKEKEVLYPKNYTFEQAEIFEQDGKYDRAMWFYINLYPENREKVVEKVNQFQEQNDTINLKAFIINSFSEYAVFDPTISNWDNGYPELNREKMDIKGSWGDAIILDCYKEDYSKQEVIPIKTKKGFMIIFNYENSKSTLRIEGEDPKLSEPFITFLVDNRALQITIVDVSDISNMKNCKNTGDTLIAHKNYELQYLGKMIEEELVIRKEETINISKIEFLLWYYTLPSKLNAQLENQYIITTLIGDKVLMFHTAGSKKEKYKTVKKYLIKYASTLDIYDENMDINKIIEGVKNE